MQESNNPTDALENSNKLSENWYKNLYSFSYAYFSVMPYAKFGTLGQISARPMLAIAAIVAGSVILPPLGAVAAIILPPVIIVNLLTRDFKEIGNLLGLLALAAVAIPIALALCAVSVVAELAYMPINFFLSLATLAIRKIDLHRKQKKLSPEASSAEQGPSDSQQVEGNQLGEALNNALTQYSKKKTWCQSRESAVVEFEFLKQTLVFANKDNINLENKARLFYDNPKNRGKRLHDLLTQVFNPAQAAS